MTKYAKPRYFMRTLMMVAIHRNCRMPPAWRTGLLLCAAVGLPSISSATALTALTGGAWSEFAAARGNAELIGNVLGATGGLASSLAGLAWVFDTAKIPVFPADQQFGATPSGIVDRNAGLSAILATASASSTANTKGPMGTAISATWGGQADAWAGVGLSYEHTGSKWRNKILGKLTEMVLDPLPPPPTTAPGSLAGLGVPVTERLEADVQMPGTDTWTAVYAATFDLFWNGSFWDLSVDDPTGQFSKSDFTRSTQTGLAGPLGPIDTTVWTLNNPIYFGVPYFTTSDLTGNGTPWSAGSEYGLQVQLLTSGVTAGVPEPASLLLIGSGLVALGAMRKRVLQ